MSSHTAPPSRRDVLHGTALASVAAIFNACSARTSGYAPSPDGSTSPDATTSPDSTTSPDIATPDAGPDSDIATLNALLTLEYAAIRAYELMLVTLNEPPPGDPLAPNAPALAVILQGWQIHHRAHAAVIESAIVRLAGTPTSAAAVRYTPPAAYTPTARNALALACNLERTMAVAYNDAVESLRAATNRALAANVLGDDTQHFVALYALLRGVLVAVPTGLITNIMDVVPRPFVANVAGASSSLESVSDFSFV